MKTLNNKTVVAVSVLIILLPFGYSIVSSVFSQSPEPFLDTPSGKCADRWTGAYMRFHHMDILNSGRDEAVREGKREGIGFDDCRSCHPSRKRFCNQCHDAVNLNLDRDCFRCHYYPPEATTTGLAEE